MSWYDTLDLQAIRALPSEIFTRSSLQLRDSENVSLLALVIHAGCFTSVPSHAITRENVMQSDTNWGTVAHLLASEGLLNSSMGLLPEDALVKDADGNTPLHVAIAYNKVSQFPDTLLTEELLLVPNVDNITPLQRIASHGHLPLLPREFVTEKNLLAVKDNSTSPLVLLAQAGHLDQVLGLDFSNAVKAIVGETWWERNKKYIAKRGTALKIEEVELESEIDLM